MSRSESAIVTAAAQKARGAFFTPAVLADFVCRWAVRRADDVVLEPSCGEAAFLLAAGGRLLELGASDAVGQLHGSEIHLPSLLASRRALADAGIPAELTYGDFFDREPRPFASAVVGNPPFIRYQDFSGEARSKAQRAAARAGVRIGGLASSWAAFVIHASLFLQEGGRLGLVLPAELLHVKYAKSVRDFLLQRFGSVTIVTFQERVFPEVMTEVVLLLAEGDGPAGALHVVNVKGTADLTNLDTPFAASVTGGADTLDKWSSVLLPSDARSAYEDVMAASAYVSLATWGRTYLGSVSGNNRYFVLSRDEARIERLNAGDLTEVAPPGSQHLKGIEFSYAAYRSILEGGGRALLFYPREPLSETALRYIERGASDGVSLAYKCRVRIPWYRVPLVPVPDIFLTYMSHQAPRLVTNSAQVNFLNSVHGIALRSELADIGRRILPIAALNSLSLLGAELVGRSYGGGVLKLEPREADHVPMPSPNTVHALDSPLDSLRPQLAGYLRRVDIDAASALVDEVVLIKHLRMKRSQVRAIRDAYVHMRSRRHARSGKQADD